MADKPTRRRRAYLDDFQPGPGGRYVYTGTVYRFDGPAEEERRWLITRGLCAAGAFAAAAAAECLPPVPVSGAVWTLLPWLVQIIAAAYALWGMARLALYHKDLRAYIYQKTAAPLSGRALFCAAAAGVTFLSQAISLCFLGWGASPLFSLARPALALATGLLGLLLWRLARPVRWQAEEPSTR